MRARRTRGFTLLEVMVALGILAGALLTISDVVGGALRNQARAQKLEIATLLARGKMAALEDELPEKGLRDFDQSDEGTFEDEGHPEVRWKLDVRVPKLELGPDAILKALTGKGLDELMQQQGGEGPLPPTAMASMPMLQTLLTTAGEQIKKGVRDVRLTVSWQDGKATESFTVDTQLVLLGGTAP